MYLVREKNGLKLFIINERVKDQYILVDNISGIIAVFDLFFEEDKIHDFQTLNGYCFGNHESYIKFIKETLNIE